MRRLERLPAEIRHNFVECAVCAVGAKLSWGGKSACLRSGYRKSKPERSYHVSILYSIQSVCLTMICCSCKGPCTCRSVVRRRSTSVQAQVAMPRNANALYKRRRRMMRPTSRCDLRNCRRLMRLRPICTGAASAPSTGLPEIAAASHSNRITSMIRSGQRSVSRTKDRPAMAPVFLQRASRKLRRWGLTIADREGHSNILAGERASMAVTIRLAEDNEIPALAQMHSEEWRDHAFWMDRITRYKNGEHSPQQALPERAIFVAVEEANVGGFTAGHRTRRFDCDGELQWVNVAVHKRGQGIAGQLVKRIGAWFVEQGAHRICVNVDTHNLAAWRLYDRCGARSLNEHWMVWDQARFMSSDKK